MLDDKLCAVVHGWSSRQVPLDLEVSVSGVKGLERVSFNGQTECDEGITVD